MKKMDPKEYEKLSNQASPPSPSFKNYPAAFCIGGLICVIGQLLTETYLYAGMPLDSARSAASVTLIIITAILTALHLFEKIGRFAGAGTLVPITGFANSMVSPAIEFKSEGHIAGIGAKMFVIAGPVLVFGISASVIYGIILWIIQMFGGTI